MRRLGVMLAVVAGIAVFGGTERALDAALALRASWPRDVDTLVLPRSNILGLLSLGHRELAADLVAARANIYFGTQLASHSDQRRLAEALNIAVDLDPRFHRLYLRGAAMLVYTGGTFTVDAFTQANQLLARGEPVFPGDWELPFQRGFNLLFELPKLVGQTDPRVSDWRQRGAEALRQAALLEGAPPWLPNLAARMLTKEGGEALAIRSLERTYAVTSNEETRAEIARKLQELRGHQAAGDLVEGAAELGRLVREGYPYAPEAFSVIMGPRQKAGVDLDALLHPPQLHGGTDTPIAPETQP